MLSLAWKRCRAAWIRARIRADTGKSATSGGGGIWSLIELDRWLAQGREPTRPGDPAHRGGTALRSRTALCGRQIIRSSEPWSGPSFPTCCRVSDFQPFRQPCHRGRSLRGYLSVRVRNLEPPGVPFGARFGRSSVAWAGSIAQAENPLPVFGLLAPNSLSAGLKPRVSIVRLHLRLRVCRSREAQPFAPPLSSITRCTLHQHS